jgi:hypothetical protein
MVQHRSGNLTQTTEDKDVSEGEMRDEGSDFNGDEG